MAKCEPSTLSQCSNGHNSLKTKQSAQFLFNKLNDWLRFVNSRDNKREHQIQKKLEEKKWPETVMIDCD